MKIMVTLEKPPPRASKVRASKKKECVETCTDSGIKSLHFTAHGEASVGTIVAANGDVFNITQAAPNDVRVLITGLLRKAEMFSTSSQKEGDDHDPDLDEPEAPADDGDDWEL